MKVLNECQLQTVVGGKKIGQLQSAEEQLVLI